MQRNPAQVIKFFQIFFRLKKRGVTIEAAFGLNDIEAMTDALPFGMEWRFLCKQGNGHAYQAFHPVHGHTIFLLEIMGGAAPLAVSAKHFTDKGAEMSLVLPCSSSILKSTCPHSGIRLYQPSDLTIQARTVPLSV